MTADLVQQRRAVLTCFRRKPDFGGLKGIAASIDRSLLLRWLDESGMAIYLAQRLVQHGVSDGIDAALRQALNERTEANRRRTSALLQAFGRVNRTLQQAGPAYEVVKGFTLTPEFCSWPWLRHQSDIDLLMPATAIDSAAECLGTLGYKLEPAEDP